MRPTLFDVAQQAGVSPSTASRAFGRPEKVDPDTRSLVLAAAETLGYQPNAAAQALATGKTGRVAVVVPDLRNPFFAAVLRGATIRLEQAGIQTLVADFGDDPETEARLIASLQRHVDALILCSPRLGDRELEKVRGECSVVLVNRTSTTLPHVHFDNAGGIQQGLQHLRALGHQRICYAAGPQSSRSARERLAAFEGSGEVLGEYPSTFDGGAQAVDAALASSATALIAYNDVQAIGAVHRILSYGMALPARLSIVGFDDLPISALVTPALTTVAIPQESAGIEAAGLILGGDTGALSLSARLVVRASTAQPGSH